MGKPKGSKVGKNDKGKQIQEDSSRNEKDSECDKGKTISKDQKYRGTKKELDRYWLRFFELKSDKKLPQGNKLKPRQLLKLLKDEVEELQAETQLQKHAISKDQKHRRTKKELDRYWLMFFELKSDKKLPQGNKLKPRQLLKLLKDEVDELQAETQLQKHAISKDQKHRPTKKERTELLRICFEAIFDEKLPQGIKLSWGYLLKVVEGYFEEKQAEMQRTYSMQQQELEKAEHMKQSRKLKCAEAKKVNKEASQAVQLLQNVFLDQGLNPKDQQTTAFLGSPVLSSDLPPLPEDIFDNLSDLSDVEFPICMEDDLMPGTSSGAGTSTAMTATGEGEYQNNGVNETFGQGLYPFPMDDFSNALMNDCFQYCKREM